MAFFNNQGAEVQSSEGGFLRLFPDGNLYLANTTYDSNSIIRLGIYRYLTSINELESQAYIATPRGNGEPLPHNNVADICAANGLSADNNLFCTTSGSSIGRVVDTPSEEVYIGAGQSSGSKRSQLLKIYPTFNRPTTVVDDVLVLKSFDNYLIVGGKNSSGEYLITRYDTTNDTEVALFGPTSSVKPIYADYSAEQNKVYFSGEHYTDGEFDEFVLGEVDLSNHDVTVYPYGARLIDFKAFRN